MKECPNCGAPLKEGKCLHCGTEVRTGRVLVTNCPNCAAPLKGGKCLHCGTEVRLANELDIDTWGGVIEVMLNIRRGDEVILLPLIGRITGISMTPCHVSYLGSNPAFMQSIMTHREVEFTFEGIIKER